MRAAVAILAALTVGCGVKNVNPDDPKTWGDRKDVWVFVAPEKELREACEKEVMPPTVVAAAAAKAGVTVVLPKKFDKADVLVSEELLKGDPKDGRVRLPYSCVRRGLFRHEATHSSHGETVIKLKKSQGHTARFRALELFKVESIEDRHHGGKEPYPFSRKNLDPPTGEREEHETGPIVTSPSILGVTYKVVFIIRGFKIDPDIECKP